MTAILSPRIHRTRAVLAILALLAVAIPAVMMLALAPTAAGAQPPAPQSFPASIRDFAFSPAYLEVHVGDTITWINEDRAPHDVTTTNAPAPFASGTLRQGQSFSYTFTEPGTYSYMCSIHPEMVATVSVVEHAAAPAEAVPPAETAPPVAAAPPAEAVPPADVVPQAPEMPADAAPADGAAAAAPPAGSSAVPAPAAGAASAGVSPAPGTTQVAGTAQPGRQLDPLLIVAAVALGVTTLCLLLISAQPASAPTVAGGAIAGGGVAGTGAVPRPAATAPMLSARHRTRGAVSPLLLRLLAAAGLAVDGYVHFALAGDYDAVGSVITQGMLFRLQGGVAVLAALLILMLGRSWVYQVVFLVAVSALVPVVLYTYVDLGALGPLPNMYEPVWYADKAISAIAEAVAAIAAGLLVLRRRTRPE